VALLVRRAVNGEVGGQRFFFGDSGDCSSPFVAHHSMVLSKRDLARSGAVCEL
jgi:hypothetical protein